MALLKSAYLIAFARFGYRWALCDPMIELRRDLRSAVLDGVMPSEPGRWALFNPTESTTAVRLGAAEEPEPLIVVQLGRHFVLLPGWQSEGRLYDRLPRADETGVVTIGGVKWTPIPTSPEYLLDMR